MQFYLILLPILYLIVAYISIFKMHSIFTRILKLLWVFYYCSSLRLRRYNFRKENWWVFIVLLLLVGNIEVTGFKELKGDKKGVNILNIISIILIVIYVILTLFLY